MTTTTKSLNISSCLENPQSALRNAFKQQNVARFKFTLENQRADPNEIDKKSDLTIFEEILETPNSAVFINLCIENGADLYKKNPHDRYPLHYAVDSLSPQNLRAFLANYDLSKINVKYFHKNSLHLIMQIVTKPPPDYNEDDAIEVIKILLNSGCDVNMPNEKSQTPFNLLLKVPESRLKKKKKIVDFIVENFEVDLFTYRAKETVDLFKKNCPERQLPEQQERISADFMISLLNKRDQEKFISHFLAFKSEINQPKTPENAENNSNDFKEISARFLQTAIKNNCENVVEYLVDDGIDVNRQPIEESKGLSPVLLACQGGNYKIVEALFKADPPPHIASKSTNILHLATQHLGMDPSKNASFSYERCFEIALEHCDDVNQQDSDGNTPLHYAARYRNDKAVIELLRKGSYLGPISVLDESPVDCMSREALETYLDECISTKPRRHGEEQQEIIIDYNFLVAPKTQDEFGHEILPLQRIANNSELRPLIAHPVFSSFLFLKWSKLWLIFLLNLLMFSFFMISLIYYIVLSSMLTPEEKEQSGSFSMFKMFSFVSILMLFLRELFQLILSPKNYLKSPINYFEIALIILGFILIYNHDHKDPNEAHMRILRAVTILFAAYEFLQLIGTLPYLSISTHMVILKKVALTFLKSLLLYSILIISFALCFFSLFGGKKKEGAGDGDKNGTDADIDGDEAFNSFNYPGIAIIKTMVMLTGEFDASALALDQNDPSYSIIFLLFVFLITIVLFNLLNALAIDDTHQIRQEGELVDLCERINVLSKFERSILNRSGLHWLKNMISVFPYTIPQGKIVIHPDINNEILTYKASPTIKDTSINIGDEQELQNLNNNHLSLKRLIPSQKISNQLEKYSKGMDGKIMKKIRNIFDERKSKENSEAEVMRTKIASLESRVNILNANIQEMMEIMRNQKNY